ncbi:MAG TPA: hypothetical protein VHS27_12810, partial [Gaiellales bacterium]|nr:hypothetical protein [Gaiellales bacterium]
FKPDGMTRDQYKGVSQQLQDSGAWPPDGLELHVMFGEGNDLRVSEVWESQEKQQAFAEGHLMEALQQNGVQLSGQPDAYPVHEFQLGGSTTTA